MKKRTLKKFLIASVSLFAIVVGIILACAGGDDFEDFYNSFFAPEVSHADKFSLFYQSNNPFYGSAQYYEGCVSAFDSTNLKEWSYFFKQTATFNDLSYVVYKSRIGEIDTLIFFLKDNKYPIKPYLRKNSLLNFAGKALVREFLFYLGFAKRCEPYATYVPYYWDTERNDDPRKNIQPMQKLIEGGKRAFVNAKNETIKERYLFQIVRLLYNAGKYNECISFYQQNKELLSTGNTIKYRTLGYVAGANYKLGNYSDANYLYAVIYDKSPEMQIISWQSFHPQDESDWEASLQFAKNNREKEVLWHLLGIYADPLRAMKEIYSINPKSDLLDVLLTRAININEESFITDFTDASNNSLAGNNIDEDLLVFAEDVANKGNTLKPYLWNLAAGYLNIAKGDYKKGDGYLQKTESKAKDDMLVLDQIRLIRIISKIVLYKNPDKKAEDELAKELSWLGKETHDNGLRNYTTYNWALKSLSAKYASFGDLIKAQCLDYSRDQTFYDDTLKVAELIALMDKPNKTKFEEFVVSNHRYSRSDLFEYQAIRLIQQYKLKEALAKFDASQGSGGTQLPADPFVIHINDCHDCDFRDEQHDTYTKYTLVKTMIELEEKAATDTKTAPQSYFLLANAFYNITYFGNSRALYYNNIKEYETSWEFSPDYADFSDFIYKCSKAEEYYKIAMTLSKDLEFKAKCCFMVAKCEQNSLFVSGELGSEDFRAGNAFKQLKARYSKTKYYQEIIKECGYFRTYLKVSNAKG